MGTRQGCGLYTTCAALLFFWLWRCCCWRSCLARCLVLVLESARRALAWAWRGAACPARCSPQLSQRWALGVG